ncbi:hypothetical protein ACFX1Z_034353 [Malus domestica]
MSEIVMAAMNGPGAPKIPAPQINFPARSASDDSELPWPRMNKSEISLHLRSGQHQGMQGSQMMLTVTASKPRMQTSSPSKPNFELHGMLLAMVVVLISSLEIIPTVVASLSAFAPQFNTFVSFAMGKILYRCEGILPQHTSWLKRRSHNSEI